MRNLYFPSYIIYALGTSLLLLGTTLQLCRFLHICFVAYRKDKSLNEMGLRNLQIVMVPLNFLSTVFFFLHAVVPPCNRFVASPFSFFFYNMNVSSVSMCIINYEYQLIAVHRSHKNIKTLRNLFVILSVVLITVPLLFCLHQVFDSFVIRNWQKAMCKISYSLVVFSSIPCVIYSGRMLVAEMKRVTLMKTFSLGKEKNARKRDRRRANKILRHIYFVSLVCFVLAFEKIIGADDLGETPYQVNLCIKQVSQPKWIYVKNVILKIFHGCIILYFCYYNWVPISGI